MEGCLDPLDELNRLASNASTSDALAASRRPSPEEIKRWQQLFNYSATEALALITQQRLDITRPRIPTSHWELVREEREALGYDREAYEHELQLCSLLENQSTTIQGMGTDLKQKEGEVLVLFRLGGLLNNLKDVQNVVGEEEPVQEVTATTDPYGWNRVQFCAVSGRAKKKIDAYLSTRHVIKKRESGQNAPQVEHSHRDSTLPQFMPG